MRGLTLPPTSEVLVSLSVNLIRLHSVYSQRNQVRQEHLLTSKSTGNPTRTSLVSSKFIMAFSMTSSQLMSLMLSGKRLQEAIM
jgi:hypothetical protein